MMSQAGGMDMNALTGRLRRLVTGDTTVFDEVRADKNFTVPAIAVAVISILLFGLGGWLWAVFHSDYTDAGDVFLNSMIVGGIAAIIVWAIWFGITYVMLAQLFAARVDMNELARVMGFAAIPLALGVLMFIPQVEFAIALTAVALTLGLTVIAVQSVTDAPAGRVLVAVGAGFFIWAVVLGLLVGTDNQYAPGIFLFESLADIIRRY